jgi:putative ATP-dependent endonuclease of OLD family
MAVRGIRTLDWWPESGVNVILGGGDAGKTTILEAVALLLNPTNNTALSDNDCWDRRVEDGFSVEAVMSLPKSCPVNQQANTAWPWEWNGTEAVLPNPEAEPDSNSTVEAVYRFRVSRAGQGSGWRVISRSERARRYS